MPPRNLGFLLIGLLLSLPAAAQEKPNFSGEWVRDNARSTPIGSSNGVSRCHIKHDDPQLEVRTQITGTTTRIMTGLLFDATYRTDGIEQATTDDRGRERWITVHWQESALAFLTVQKQDGKVTVIREIWSLSDAGKTLTKIRRTIGPEAATLQRFVFERQ